MKLKNEKPSLYDMPMDQLTEYLLEKGHKKFNAVQVFNWAHRYFGKPLEEWTNVSKKIKADLQEDFQWEMPKVIWHGLSKDGTRKFLMQLSDKQTIETVAIPAKDRLTLCISSQVGCAIGCTFCHTGTMGLKRHLEAHEIVGQFLVVGKWLKDNVESEQRLTNIVYMGQGEPLHNYENVKKATQIFMEDNGLGLGQRRITLSTSGLVPQIEKLGTFPPVNIAISLHAAHDNIRTELMPINKVYDLNRLFEAIRSIPLKAHRRITYEYLLIDGMNDRIEDIEALCELLDITKSKINLIPFNEYPESEFKRPSANRIKWFQNQLINRGYVCTTRVTMGTDILAACGQLKSEHEKVNLWNQQNPNQPAQDLSIPTSPA
jgi:23S rRNA (adenine2503-C2)-methyltransferase